MYIEKQLETIFENAGVIIPALLLPDINTCDYNKWSVVACDQFTSQPAYWKYVEDYVGEAPSSLRIVLPEIYLADNFPDRIESIHAKMEEYLAGDVFMEPYKGFILTERVFGAGEQAGAEKQVSASRWGLVLAIDLEKYSFEPNARTLIRSTEGTVRDRLPPRIEIRRGAALELPHVLLLANDEGRALIETLANGAVDGLYKKAYDFDLMAEGGHIRGYRIDEQGLQIAAYAFETLLHKAKAASKDPMIFAVGDGNHSLAAAKVYWEELKKTLSDDEAKISPARYALVELINLHSEGVKFEPIHRALFNAEPQTVIEEAQRYFKKRGVSITTGTDNHDNEDQAPRVRQARSLQKAGDAVRAYEFIMMYDGGKPAKLRIEQPESDIAVAEIQGFIDSLCAKFPGITVDYIHGEDELTRLAVEEGCFCFKVPPFDKSGFFPMIAAGGLLPRKAFSMGEARDKRYYFEARKLTP